MKFVKRLLKLFMHVAIVFAAFVVFARFLFPLPDIANREASLVIKRSSSTDLGDATIAAGLEHQGQSGVYPLYRGDEAFAARMLLARQAQESIDIRYYIWQRDDTGLLLLKEIEDAARRGVRVRLLVDDNGTPDLGAELSALNVLDTMEVRIFNPFNLRSPRMVSYLFDFFRLNRRMHNKSFSVDDAVSIIGGRNIGDTYFSRGLGSQYSDFDLMVVGDAVSDLSADFDRYWNSQSAYPHELLMEPDAGGIAKLDGGAENARAQPDWDIYAAALSNSNLASSLMAGDLLLDWVNVTLFSDDPAKGLRALDFDELIIADLGRIISGAESSLDLISAYFIPGEEGTKVLTDLAQRGVRVRTLTNSLSATDVVPVHAGYVRYRHDLLEGGVDVYELKADQSPTQAKALGLIGTSAASLHAKTFAIDGNRIFIGSFNFDPRSAFLNCEMGFLVESPRISATLTERFDQNLGSFAWHVTLDEKGGLRWASEEDSTLVSVAYEPGSTLFTRITLAIVSALPVEWML